MSVPIKVFKIEGGGGGAQPVIVRKPEKSAQTFLSGVPVKVDANGFVIESGAIAGAGEVIAGFSTEFGHNLTSDGVAQELSYGKVENQASAKLIPVGAPPSDGNMGIVVANALSIFKGNYKSDQNSAAADVGDIFGITKGADNQWYIDKTKTTVGGGAIVTIQELIDPAGTAGGLTAFRVNQANRQLDV